MGIILSQKWKDNVLEVKRDNNRLMSIRLKGGLEMVTEISAYGPQVGCEEKEKEALLMDLEGLIKEVSKYVKLVIGGDLNGHVGRESNGYDVVITAMNCEMKKVCNTRYRKRDEYLITYNSGR